MRSDGNAGQGPSSIFGIVPAEVVLDDEFLARRHAHAVVAELDVDAEPRERRQDRDEVVPARRPRS